MGSVLKYFTYHLPEKVFSNDEFYRIFPSQLEIADKLDKIGVKERRISADGETAVDLAVKAGEKFFKTFPLKKEEIDFVIFNSSFFDYKFPASACIIHKELGLLPECGGADLSHGCSAYPYAVQMARGLVEMEGLKNVLILTSYTLTKDIHPKDKASRFLFGDGAAASLVQASPKSGIYKCHFGTESRGWNKIIKRDGNERHPISDASLIEHSDEYGNTTTNEKMFMDGTGVFLFAIRRVPEFVHQLLKKNQMSLDDIDLFVFHQANLFMIDVIVEKLGIPPSKVFNNMHKVGNTVGATIPIALADAQSQGKLIPGSKVLIAGFGVGFALSGTIFIVD